MACIQNIYICSFLVAVIAGHDFLLTEGRQPKTLNKQNFKSFEADKGLTNHGKQSIGSKQVPRGHKGDLQVTGPIAGHDVSGTKEVFQPMSPNGQSSPEVGSSLTVHVNGFQPTAPGNSPGVGHSSRGRKQIEQKAPSTTPNLAYSLEGSTDDFRPTAPGRSPGVGHSIRNTKAEPNS